VRRCAPVLMVFQAFWIVCGPAAGHGDLEPGRCYVLIGENGAGEGRPCCGFWPDLLRPSFGAGQVFGGLDPHDARDRIGYMSHAPMLYDELTALENLRYFSSLYPGRPSLSPGRSPAPGRPGIPI